MLESELDVRSVLRLTAPGVPTGVSARAIAGSAPFGNGKAFVSFRPAGSAATSYRATSSPRVIVADDVTSPVAVSGLVGGQAYVFTVHATNSAGSSAESAFSSPFTPQTSPDRPTIGTAVAGHGSATVSFTPPAANGGSAITGYTVTATPGNVVAVGTSSPITVTGLTNGTPYAFTVHATNSVGDSVESDVSNKATPGGPVELLDAGQRTMEGPGIVGWTGLDNCTVARSSHHAHGGSSALAITATGAGQMDVGVTAPWPAGRAGKSYTVSLWIYEGAASHFPTVLGRFGAPGNAFLQDFTSSPMEQLNTWFHATASAVAPDTTNSVRIQVAWFAMAAGETIYIDDASLTET